MNKLRAGANALRPDRSGRVAFASEDDSERKRVRNIERLRQLILVEVPLGRRVEVVKMLLALEREAGGE